MSKKIITVDLNFPTETSTVEEIVNEPVDEYTAVKEEATIGPPPELTQPKPKRKPAPKKPVNVPVSEPVFEQIVEQLPAQPLSEPVVEIKETQKVKCHHCSKEMTMKSLKYSHSRNCLGLKKTIEKVSNEKVSQKVEVKPSEASPSAPVRMKTEQENPRTVRLNLLKERYNNLVKNAFN